MTLSEVIRNYRAQRGYTQQELAERIRKMPNCEAFSAQSYAAIESGKTQRTGFLLEIAKALDIPLELLANPPSEHEPMLAKGEINCWQIPVFTYADITNFFNKKEANPNQWELIDKNIISQQGVGVIVEGVAMAPDFNHKEVAIIDPAIPAAMGDFVLVKLNDTVAIRQFQQEGTQRYLLTTNPLFQHPAVEITEQITLYGTVVRKIKRFY